MFHSVKLLFLILGFAFGFISCRKAMPEGSLTASDKITSAAILPQPLPYPIQFRAFAELSIKRVDIVAAAAGNKILFAGGVYGVNNGKTLEHIYVSRVDIFNATTLQRTTAELSVPRSGIGAAALGNKIYFAGGFSDVGVASDRIDIYDVVTNTWSTAKLSQPRGHVAVAAAGNKVVFAGGYNSEIYPTPYYSPVIDVYDISTKTWTVGSFASHKLPVAASAGSLIAIAGKNSAYEPKCRILNVTSNSWTSIDLNDHGGDYHPGMVAARAAGKIIIAFGGWSPPSSVVDILNGRNQVTSLVRENARNYAGTCSAGDYAFIIGGKVHGTDVSSDLIDVYNGQLNKWYTRKLKVPLQSPKCAATGSTIMVAISKEVQVFNITGEPPATPL